MSSLVIAPYIVAGGDTFVMPYRQDVMGWSSVDGSSGVTYTRAQASTVLGGGTAGQASAADADLNDYMEWHVNLAAGTYTLTDIHTKDTNRGIATYSLDGTSLGTVDKYQAFNVLNAVAEITGIVVAADGNYTLRIEATSKNASSSDYIINLNTVTLTRTGA